MLSFGRLRQRILLKCRPHVLQDYFFSFDQPDHCFLALSLSLTSSLLKLPIMSVAQLLVSEWACQPFSPSAWISHAFPSFCFSPHFNCSMSCVGLSLSYFCWCGDMLFWLRSLVISVMQFGDNSGLHLIIFDEFDAVCKSRYMYNVRNIWSVPFLR